MQTPPRSFPTRVAQLEQRAATGRAHSDTINSWWCTPRSHYDELRQRVYFGGNSRAGLMHCGYFDLRRKTVHSFPLGGYEADDHNTPALLIEDDLPPIVAYARHGNDNVVRVRRGTAAHALDTLSAPIEVPFASSTSYAHLIRRPGTETIALLTRQGSDGGLYASISLDAGITWGAPYRLIGSAYVTFKQNSNTIHAVSASHPTTTPNASARYFKIDATTGDITSAHSATVLGNLWTTTTVVSSNSMTIIYQYADTDVPYNGVRVFDIGKGGSVAVMDFSKSNPAVGGVYKVRRYKTGGLWAEEILTTSGDAYYNASAYVGGMYFGATDNEVYLCRESNDTWTLERWTTPGAGQAWSLADTLETRTDGNRLARPIVPRNGEGKGVVLVGDYHRYDPLNYYDYYADEMVVTHST